MVKSRYIGDGHPTFNRNPYNGYINPYYWVDDHPLLYGNNGSLDPGTHPFIAHRKTQPKFQALLFVGGGNSIPSKNYIRPTFAMVWIPQKDS